MAVDLDHSFSTARTIDDMFATILDLERVVPCVEGATVLERTGPEAVKAEIKVKMGAMSMTFTGTLEITEQDPAAHTAVLTVKSREAGGQGFANATIAFALNDGGGRSTPTPRSRARPRRWARASSPGCSMRWSRTSPGSSESSEAGPMATIVMRADPPGRGPARRRTAIQEDADRPVFHGNGPDDYVCVQCGNLLAAAMDGDLHDQEGARPLRPLRNCQRRGHRRDGGQAALSARRASRWRT